MLSFSRALFRLGDPIKQTKPGKYIGVLAFKDYAHDQRLFHHGHKRVLTKNSEYMWHMYKAVDDAWEAHEGSLTWYHP